MAQSTAVGWTTTATNAVTASSYTPSANSLIAVIAAYGNGNGIGWTSLAISDTLTGTSTGSWYQLSNILATNAGGSAIWVKDAGSSPGVGNITVTASPATVINGGLVVLEYTGALPAAYQVAGVQGSAQGTISNIVITPTFTGSQLIGGAGKPNIPTWTANGSTTILGQTQGAAGDAFASFYATSQSTAGTAASLGFTSASASSGICAAEIMPSTANVLALVGSAGTVAVSAAGSGASPSWGAGTSQTAGDLLVALVAGAEITGATPPTPSGWTLGASVTAASTSMTMFWKIAAGSDTAPTFTGNAANVQSAMLLEFAPSNGTISSPPTDQSGTQTTTTTSTPNAVTASATDTGTNAELVIGGTSISYSAAATKTLTNTPGEAMAFTVVDNHSTSTRAHYSFYWGHTNSNSAADSNSLAYTSTNGQGSSQIIQSFLLPTAGSVITQSLGASITPAVTMNRQTGALVSATLNFTGSFVRVINHGISATANFAGTFVRAINHGLTAAKLNFAGAMAKQTLRTLIAVLSFVGTFVNKAIGALLTGTLNFAGTFTRAITSLLSATLNFAGAMVSTRFLTQALNATLNFAGTISRQTGAALSGTLSFVGTFASKAITALLSGTLNFAGTLAKQTNRVLSGVLNFAGSITTSKFLAQVFSATLNFVGTTTRAVTTGVLGSATLNLVGTVAKQTNRAFLALFNPNTYRFDIGGELHFIWPAYDLTATQSGGSWSVAAANSPSNPPGYIICSIAGDGGPGTSADPQWQTNITNATKAGWTVLGYVNTSNGTNTLVAASVVEHEADLWFQLYNDVGGIFLDQVLGSTANGTAHLAAYTSYHDYIKQHHGSFAYIVGNVGGNANSSFISPAVLDVIITFENTESVFDVGGVPPSGITGTNIGYILQTCTSSATVTTDIREAKALGATFFWGSDGPANYSQPPSTGFFNTMQSQMDTNGTLYRLVEPVKTAALNWGGSFTRAVGALLTGVLNFVGSLVYSTSGQFFETLNATLNFTGSAVKQTNKGITATLSFAASMARAVAAQLSGVLSFAGTFARAIRAVFSGTLNFVGTLVKQTNRTLSATLSFAGSIVRQAQKALSGTLSFAGTITRKAIAHLLSGTLGPVGTLAKQTARALSAVLSWIGSVVGQIIGTTEAGKVTVTNEVAGVAVTYSQAAVALTAASATVSIDTEVLT